MKNPKRQTVKNSKHQAPNIREAPNHKEQPTTNGYPSSSPATNDWVLRDEPTSNGERHAFDLEERTAKFGEAIIRFAKKIPHKPENNRLISQVVGAGTSAGANYCEANERVSKKDFRNTVGRCKKEAKETMFFLRMIATAEPDLAQEARVLYREAKELMLIFASIYRK
jgi:four helix bundle protein